MSSSTKVGSSHDAPVPSGEGDFGVQPGTADARYASGNAVKHDPGKAQARSGTGPRTSGVGGDDAGPGSSSGGDLDVGGDALTGVADPHLHPVRHGSRDADPSDAGREMLDTPVVHPDPARAGHVDGPASTSAADVHNETERGDDAFAGDLTADEATGNSSY